MKQPSLRDRWENLAVVGGLGLVLWVVYAPLARWLTHAAATHEQLATGGILVLIATAVSFREIRDSLRMQWRVCTAGIVLLVAGAFMSLAARLVPAAAVPLMLLSFALSLSALISFVYGMTGIRVFLPPLAAVVVLGIMAAAVPRLDWPLRAIAAQYAGHALGRLGVPVQVDLVSHRPPALLLVVKDRVFEVAGECNGFGLLTSLLVFAAILMFRYRLRWFRKAGLLALAAPLAIFANAGRIIGICLIATHASLPYPLIHEGVGALVFLAAMAAFWAVARQAEEPGETILPASPRGADAAGPDADPGGTQTP